MKIKTLLVDVGGVLVRTMDTSKRGVWEKKLGMQPGQLTELVFQIEPAEPATIGKATENEIWKDVAHRYSLRHADLNLLIKDFYAGNKLNREFYDYINKIRTDFKTVLFTNAWDNARKIYTERYGLNKISDEMIVSAEVGLRKPDKRFYKYALSHLNSEPHETLFVDDTLENIKAAKLLGIHTVLFIDASSAIQEINKLIA